jgi:hypothetical protein
MVNLHRIKLSKVAEQDQLLSMRIQTTGKYSSVSGMDVLNGRFKLGSHKRVEGLKDKSKSIFR